MLNHLFSYIVIGITRSQPTEGALFRLADHVDHASRRTRGDTLVHDGGVGRSDDQERLGWLGADDDRQVCHCQEHARTSGGQCPGPQVEDHGELIAGDNVEIFHRVPRRCSDNADDNDLLGCAKDLATVCNNLPRHVAGFMEVIHAIYAGDFDTEFKSIAGLGKDMKKALDNPSEDEDFGGLAPTMQQKIRRSPLGG